MKIDKRFYGEVKSYKLSDLSKIIKSTFPDFFHSCNFLKDHNWDEFVKNRKRRADLFKSTLEIYDLKFDVLEKLDTNENNLAEHRLNEINLDNSSASKYLINKLKEV